MSDLPNSIDPRMDKFEVRQRPMAGTDAAWIGTNALSDRRSAHDSFRMNRALIEKGYREALCGKNDLDRFPADAPESENKTGRCRRIMNGVVFRTIRIRSFCLGSSSMIPNLLPSVSMHMATQPTPGMGILGVRAFPPAATISEFRDQGEPFPRG